MRCSCLGPLACCVSLWSFSEVWAGSEAGFGAAAGWAFWTRLGALILGVSSGFTCWVVGAAAVLGLFRSACRALSLNYSTSTANKGTQIWHVYDILKEQIRWRQGLNLTRMMEIMGRSRPRTAPLTHPACLESRASTISIGIFSTKCNEIQRNITRFYQMQRDSTRFYEMQRDSAKHNEIKRQ